MAKAAGDSKFKLVVAEGPASCLASHFLKSSLRFCEDFSALREHLYKAESALLFLPAHKETSLLYLQKFRKDRYLEVLPIVLYSEEKISPEEQKHALQAGANDFLFTKDDSFEVSKGRVLAHANLYWKLKRENSESLTIDPVQSVEFLDSLIEHLPNMIFVKDAKELRFVRFNRAGEKLLGYSRQDLIGKNDYDFFPKDQADHFTSKDRAVISSGHLLDIPEEPIHTKEGLRILHTRKIPLYDERGNPAYLLGISEDITEIKKAEHERLQLMKEQAARLEAEKGIELRDEFLSVASHELKTPLTSLNLQFQVLKRWVSKKDFSDEAIQKLLKIFQASFYQLERLAGLVEDLLDVSRIQAGRLSYNFEVTNLDTLLRESIARLTDQIRAAGCALEWGEMSGECLCHCDSFRVEQCITNLITNAIKYGAAKPIEVSLQKKEKVAQIRIKDSGMGIDSADQEKIFARFERAVSSRNISGLGLGLFITKQIVEAHRGKIFLKSKLGEGSLFILELPLAETD